MEGRVEPWNDQGQKKEKNAAEKSTLTFSTVTLQDRESQNIVQNVEVDDDNEQNGTVEDRH